MNNIQFPKLVQDSEEFKIILYKLTSNIYDLTLSNQPYLLVTALVFLVVFTVIVYLMDKRKKSELSISSSTVKINDVISEEKTDEKCEEKTDEKCEEKTKTTSENQNISSTSVTSDIKNILEEINELKKELECLRSSSVPKVSWDCEKTLQETDKANETNETNEVMEDMEDELTNNKIIDESVSEYLVKDIQNKIPELSPDQIQKVLQTCAEYVLIPNWYTKKDFEELSNVKFSNKAWNKLLASTDEHSENLLFDETNAMVVSWFENNLADKFEKVPYGVSSIEDSDNEDSSESDNESDSDYSGEESSNLLLDSDGSDEESDNEDNDSDEEEPTESEQPINSFIVKQLEKLKCAQLKKIAGIKSNGYSKEKLIEIITKDCTKLNIIKALKIIG